MSASGGRQSLPLRSSVTAVGVALAIAGCSEGMDAAESNSTTVDTTALSSPETSISTTAATITTITTTMLPSTTTVGLSEDEKPVIAAYADAWNAGDLEGFTGLSAAEIDTWSVSLPGTDWEFTVDDHIGVFEKLRELGIRSRSGQSSRETTAG